MRLNWKSEILKTFSVHCTQAFCSALNLQLDTISRVYEAHATAVHGPITMEWRSISSLNSEEKLKIQMLGFVFFFHKEVVGLSPEAGANDAFVVQHIGQAVNRNSDFGQEDGGEDELFIIPGAWGI